MSGEYATPDPTTRPEDAPYSVGREERLPAQAGGGEKPQHEGRCVACDYVFFYDEPADESSHPKLCDDCIEKGEIGP